MRKPISILTRMATPVTVVCGLLAVCTCASAEPEERHCSNGTIAGDYGWAAEGELIDLPGLPSEAPFRSVGAAHFDGSGTLTWEEHTVLNGMPLNSGWAQATGTYTVNSNCTGTAVVNTPNSRVPLSLFFVVAGEGKEIRSVLDSNAVSTLFIKIE